MNDIVKGTKDIYIYQRFYMSDKGLQLFSKVRWFYCYDKYFVSVMLPLYSIANNCSELNVSGA